MANPPDVGLGLAAPQVPACHYDFQVYMTKRRWASLWHQAHLIASLEPHQVLEVGVGNGLLGVLCEHLGISHRSVDLASDLNPDILASVQAIPLGDQSIDLTCAFQVLEHIPYPEALRGFRELCRVSRRDILISLPNATYAFPLLVSLPLIGGLRSLIELPVAKLGPMISSHRWEIGRAGTPLRRVIRDFSREARLVQSFRVFEMPYHHFFHFQRH